MTREAFFYNKREKFSIENKRETFSIENITHITKERNVL